jgi:hypothetical protein
MGDINYFNISIGNCNPATAGQAYNYTTTEATVDAYLTEDIIDNPSDYYLSVQRFSIPLLNIPVSISSVQTNQPDINKTIFSFTMTNGAFSSGQIFIQHIPGYFESNPPPSPVGNLQDFTSNYYYIYSYQQLLSIWNSSLLTAFNALNAVLPVPSRLVNPPFFYFSNGLISLYVPKVDNYINGTTKIYFNNNFYQFVNNLYYYNVADNSITGQDNYFLFNDYKGTDEKIINGITYNTQTESSTGTAYFSFLKSIVIATTMNVKYESYFINNSNIKSPSNINYSSILTDFLPDVSSIGGSNTLYIFNATSILSRLFEFEQKTPLKIINLSILITDKYDNVYPLYNYKNIAPASIKIGFFKKTLIRGLLKN